MSFVLRSNYSHLAYGTPVPLTAAGGDAPYTYALVSASAGGSVSSGGVYTSGYRPGSDVVQVTDGVGRKAYLKLYTGTAMHLLADIIKTEMGLAEGRVYIYDQKIMMPTDSGLFVALSMLSCKPFGTKSELDPTTNEEILSCNFYASVQMDIISKSTEALLRKEEVLMSLASQYSERQQAINSFKIGRLSTNFTNLSAVDGTAIPYRFSITCGLQYLQKKTKAGDYYDTFEDPEILVNN